MPGICAGVEGKISIGDVAIASDVYDCWASSKLITDQQGSPVIERKVTSYQTLPTLLNWANQQQDNHEWRRYLLIPNITPNAVIGSITTVPFVVQNLPELMEKPEFQKYSRKTIGIEMEGIAIYEIEPSRSFARIVVKGVCDYGDGNKDDKYHGIAAESSAAFVLHMLLHHFDPAKKTPSWLHNFLLSTMLILMKPTSLQAFLTSLLSTLYLKIKKEKRN